MINEESLVSSQYPFQDSVVIRTQKIYRQTHIKTINFFWLDFSLY
ncbi:hypothetical protein B481_2717 [Planococcus halocryophilus Or1]|nr:hypothetical protein B481_2717 [Planococcus halocryophilus Or1]